MSIEWHLDEELAGRYEAGSVPPVVAASVEQHLVHCATCRGMFRVDAQRLERLWSEIVERVEAPRTTLVERFLHRLGLDNGTALLVAATPSLRGAWLCGVVMVLALAILAAQQGAAGVALFMTLAPVLPVVGVALAFGPATDPTHEIASASPYSAVRLLAVRSVVVVTSTGLPALVAGIFLPGPTWYAVAWLLPALALTTGTLALATRFPPEAVAVVLVGVWASLVIPALVRHGNPLLAADPRVQLVSLLALAAGAGVLAARRHELPELLRRIS